MELDSDITPERFGISEEKLDKQYKEIIFTTSGLEYEIQSDIYNDSGALLVKSGEKVSPGLYQKILKHRLLKPIDESLVFEDANEQQSMSGQIFTAISQVFTNISVDFEKTVNAINEIVKKIKYDRVVENKISVFKHQHSQKYNHALICAFIATDIGISFNYGEEQLQEIFSAALLHDIGMLFLKSDHQDESSLSDDEIKMEKVHPVISYMLLKESRTDFSDLVLSTVLNHHERIDGSGYPRGLQGLALHQYTRILGAVDTFEASVGRACSSADAIKMLKASSYKEVILGDEVFPLYDFSVVQCLEEYTERLNSEETNEIEDIELISALTGIIDDFVSLDSLFDTLLDHLNEKLKEAEVAGRSFNQESEKIFSHLYDIKKRYIDSTGIKQVSYLPAEMLPELQDSIRSDFIKVIPALRQRINYIVNAYTNQKGIVSKEIFELLGDIGETTKQICDKMDRTIFKTPKLF